MLSLISFLIVLSVLVLVHEFGHFIAAKKTGVRVEKFSFGFGPKVVSFKGKDTEYLISLIPLGGYVKMAGDEPGENLTSASWEYLSRTPSERFRIIFAGPLLNYVLAFLIFSAIFMYGSPTLTTEVGGLLKDYPAAAQGIKVGDKIMSVDGTPVKHWEDMTAIIHKHDETPMTLKVARGGREFDVRLKPIVRKMKDIFGKERHVALIGVSPSQAIEKVRYGPLKALYMGGKKLIELTALTYKSLFAMMTGQLSLRESMTGPIGIFVITGKAAELGLIYLLHFMAILSASLAIFNLLPFPVLDGGHIIFLALEKLRGRPLSLKTQELITNVGIGFLVLLAVFVFYNDIVNFGIAGKIIGVFKR